MKIFTLSLAVFLLTLHSGVSAQTSTAGPSITWEKDTHDFGDIIAGEKVAHTFKFTNTGTESLIITNVQVTCGCTTPGWPRDPLGPGKRAEIVIQFNSIGKIGRQNKVVTVVSNAVGGNSQIKFTANVIEKKTAN